MNESRVLISGDYWHDEFRNVLAGFPTPVTLTQVARLDSMSDQSFDLIVLAQARPDQIPAEVVERIQANHPNTPVVALLGSWCEGGMRSDVPWPGVRRIYWHQWAGRFEQFSKNLAESGITLWHQPDTATDADDAQASPTLPEDQSSEILVAISAADQTQFEYLRDALEPHGWKSCWVERATFDNDALDQVSALCVDANSFSEELHHRLIWLDSLFAGKPTTLLLNFPRHQDVTAANQRGIHEIVSKPFQPNDLKYGIEVSINRHHVASTREQTIPAPHMVKAGTVAGS